MVNKNEKTGQRKIIITQDAHNRVIPRKTNKNVRHFIANSLLRKICNIYPNANQIVDKERGGGARICGGERSFTISF